MVVIAMRGPKRAAVGVLIIIAMVGSTIACGFPDTPHPVISAEDDSCLACHEEGVGNAVAIDHPERTHCVSCHEVQDYAPPRWRNPGSIETPHGIADETDDSCLACHAEGVAGASVTPHPDQSGCLSCHVPAE